MAMASSALVERDRAAANRKYEELVNAYEQDEGVRLPTLMGDHHHHYSHRGADPDHEFTSPQQPEAPSLRRSEVGATVSSMASVLVQMRRMEATLAAQSRTLAETQQQLHVLQASREMEARQAEPSAKAMFRVAARQETDERRIEDLVRTSTVMKQRLDQMEEFSSGLISRGARRFEALESRLNGVSDVRRIVTAQAQTAEDLAATAVQVQAQRATSHGLRGDVDRMGRQLAAGEAQIRHARDESTRQHEDVRARIEGEAAATRRAVEDEAMARRDQDVALERRFGDRASRLEKKAKEDVNIAHRRVDVVESALDDERVIRAKGLEGALDELEARWRAVRNVRASDQEAQSAEADTLRAALRVALNETERRVDELKDSCDAAFEEVKTDAKRDCDMHYRDVAEVRKKVADKLAELERVLSAEIAARRSGLSKAAGRLEASDKKHTLAIETVANNAASATKKLAAKIADDLAEHQKSVRQLGDVVDAKHECSLRHADAGDLKLRDAFEAALAASAALAADRDRQKVRADATRTARARQIERRVDAARVEAETNLKALRVELISTIDEVKDEARRHVEVLKEELRVEKAAMEKKHASDQQRNADTRRVLRAQVQDLVDATSAALSAAVRQDKRASEVLVDAERKARIAGFERASEDHAVAVRELRSSVAKTREDAGKIVASTYESLLKAMDEAKEAARSAVEDEARARDDADQNLRQLVKAATKVHNQHHAALVEKVKESSDKMEALDAQIADAVVAEGKAARAASRALIEAERAARIKNDSDLHANIQDIVKATASRLKARGDEQHACSKRHIDKLSRELTYDRSSLVSDFRATLEAIQAEESRRVAVQGAVSSLVDRVADVAQLDLTWNLANDVVAVDQAARRRDREVRSALRHDHDKRKITKATSDVAAFLVDTIAESAAEAEVMEVRDRIDALSGLVAKHTAKTLHSLQDEAHKRSQGDTDLHAELDHVADRANRALAGLGAKVGAVEATASALGASRDSRVAGLDRRLDHLAALVNYHQADRACLEAPALMNPSASAASVASAMAPPPPRLEAAAPAAADEPLP